MSTRSQEQQASARRFTRDGVILVFGLSMSAYEIAFGGARPSVLTFLSGLLLSPLALRFDEARRNGKSE